MDVGARTDAKKQSYSEERAKDLLSGIETLVSARGKKVTTLDLKGAKPAWKEIAPFMLGPTGKLRAPVIRKGKTLLIGFEEESYKEFIL